MAFRDNAQAAEFILTFHPERFARSSPVTHFATRVCSGILCGLFFLAGAAQAQTVKPTEKSPVPVAKVLQDQKPAVESKKVQDQKPVDQTKKAQPEEKPATEVKKAPLEEKPASDSKKAPLEEKPAADSKKAPLEEKPAADSKKVPPAEKLFPKTTQGFISIANVEALIDHFNSTQLGELTADPVMKPFTEDVKRQFERRWSNVHDRLGVSLEDLREVPGGEVAIGLIEPAKKESAIAIAVDITGHQKQAQEMLDKINKNLTTQGAKRSELKAANYAEPIIQFLLPVPEEEREAEGSQLGAKPGSVPGRTTPTTEVPPARYAFYFMSGDFLCTADNLDVMRGIIARLAGKGVTEESLSQVPGFKMISDRCASDAGAVVPQFRWFVHPIGYAAVARAATPADQRRRGKSFLELMQNQGFAAIKGVGGFASFSDESFDLVHRTAVYAPQPYEKSMKMLKFINGEDYTPQDWVPADIATYSSFYFDILNAFDNFGPMFDELYGGGESGVWIDTLESLKTDPHGPKIDLRKELIELLDQRITVVTDYQMPITTSSERILIGIQVKKDKDQDVAKAIEKSMKGDPNAKPRKVGDLVIWEIVEQEESDSGVPEVQFGDEPSLNVEKKKPMKGEDRLFPHAAITVVKGQLFVASHMDFLQKILKSHESRDLLRNAADYQLVNETIDGMQPKENCVRVFSRTDEEYHPTYELIRQNKMPESESMLGRILNQLFGEGKKGQPRHQKLDGSQLPEYDTVRHYLAPAGLQATAEKDGWFIKGFTVSKATALGEEKETPKAEEKKDETPKPELKEEPKPEPKDDEKAKPEEDEETEK
jgi:hypothetical protein